jgi:DNA-binding transcriptional LysR family regulator
VQYTVPQEDQYLAGQISNLNELHYFTMVARARSFTSAAGRLNLPKSTISRAIQSLEQRLNIQLLQRTTRSVRLTEAGQIYLAHCEKVMEEIELADGAIGAMMASPKGTLRIGAPVAFARFLLEPLMHEFLLMYPQLQISIELLQAKERQSYEHCDLVVRAGPLEDSDWLVKHLMRVRLGLYTSTSLLSRNRRPQSPADLSQYPCIVSSCGAPGEVAGQTTWRLRREKEVREVRVAARLSIPDPAVHHQLALKGLGIAMLAQTEVVSDLKERRLVRVLAGWEPEPIDLYALHPARLAASPKLRVLLDFLLKHCQAS